MISIRTWMTLFIALCAPSLAHAQSTTPTGDLSPIAPLYAQNDPSHTGKQKDEKKEKKADKKPKKADKKQSKSGDVKKSSKKNAPLSREELLTDIVNRLDDVTKAYGAGQKGTAVVLCREIIADLTPIIDDTHAIQIALACGSLFAENDLNDEELALYEQLEKRDLTPEMKSKICLAKSTVLTKMLRYEDAKSLMLTCPKHEPFDQMIEGNLAELYMTMGEAFANLAETDKDSARMILEDAAGEITASDMQGDYALIADDIVKFGYDKLEMRYRTEMRDLNNDIKAKDIAIGFKEENVARLKQTDFVSIESEIGRNNERIAAIDAELLNDAEAIKAKIEERNKSCKGLKCGSTPQRWTSTPNTPRRYARWRCTLRI